MRHIGWRVPIAALALAIVSCASLSNFGVTPRAGRYGPSPTPTPTPLPTPTATPTPAATAPLSELPGGAPETAPEAPEAAPTEAPVVGAPLDHIVASVDGDPITLREVHSFAQQSGHPFEGDDLAVSDTGKAMLKVMIGQLLLQHEMKKYDSKIDEGQVDRYIEELRNEKHMTDKEFRAAVVQSGVSYQDFRKQARFQLERQMMVRDEVRDKVNVTDKECRAYYDSHLSEFTISKERYRLAQVLIAVAPNAMAAEVAAARKRADDVRTLASRGGDFSDLARRYSDDDTKANGGELGWFEPNEIMDEILTGVRGLKAGQISPVVQSKHGFHVLKVEAHEVPGPVPFEQMKDQIRDRLVDDKSKDRIGEWIDTELIKTHYVEINY